MNIAQQLREWAENIRRKPAPLSDTIPMVCKAADEIDALKRNALSPEFIEKLKAQAKRVAWIDDEEFMPDDYAGGNIDDAYNGGSEDGETTMARQVLKELGIEWD